MIMAEDYPPLSDAYGRRISYLRLSVTDRCNLRCLYCVPRTGKLSYLPHAAILRYEEFLRLIRLAVAFGARKVRLTGGEPFARKGFMSFVRALRREFPGLVLGVTTNATVLRRHVQELKDLGVDGLNISLDTLDPEVFFRITGQDSFAEVRAALDAALEAGLRVKINAVGLKGVNDRELPAFIRLARENPIDLRIIEYMPLGGRGLWSEAGFWPAAEILETARALADLTPAIRGGRALYADQAAAASGATRETAFTGPAKVYDIQGGHGRFGVITPVSDHFCASCNRLRITSDGQLRTCLFSDQEYDLRALLRDPETNDRDLYRFIQAANREKPMGTELLRSRSRPEAVIARRMTSIGG